MSTKYPLYRLMIVNTQPITHICGSLTNYISLTHSLNTESNTVGKRASEFWIEEANKNKESR